MVIPSNYSWLHKHPDLLKPLSLLEVQTCCSSPGCFHSYKAAGLQGVTRLYSRHQGSKYLMLLYNKTFETLSGTLKLKDYESVCLHDNLTVLKFWFGRLWLCGISQLRFDGGWKCETWIEGGTASQRVKMRYCETVRLWDCLSLETQVSYLASTHTDVTRL